MFGTIGVLALAAVGTAAFSIYRWLDVAEPLDLVTYQPEKYDSRKPELLRQYTSHEVEEIKIETTDFRTLYGLFLKWRGKDNEHCPKEANVYHGRVVLVCGDRVGNMYRTLEQVVEPYLLPQACHIFLFDYRGFGRSTGAPSEDGLYRDARAAWTYLHHILHIPATHILLYGVGLGGAVAAELATHITPCGLVLHNAISSMDDIPGHRSTRLLLGDLLPNLHTTINKRFWTYHYLKEVPCPTLILHNVHNEWVPFRHSIENWRECKHPSSKRLIILGDVEDVDEAMTESMKAVFIEFVTGNTHLPQT